MKNRSALSITQLNTIVRDTLMQENRLQNIWIEGEIFNLTHHSSGHIYFSLKDDRSVVNCTFFRGANLKFRKFKLKEGMQILASGSISLYLPRGNYQFNVSGVLLAGEGELRIKIENLKKKLQKEGLFEIAAKKSLPFLPITLGVATAPEGAAIQDIIRVARNRFPEINIILAPCLVQGPEAPESIIAAITALNNPELNVDVIIAGRGGGSFEDLMAFNEEKVVRAFAASKIPIISAVGHEIDSPISDLVADAFSPTPSAAAERVIPIVADIQENIEDLVLRMYVFLKNRHQTETKRLALILSAQIFTRPAVIIENTQQRFDSTIRDMKDSMKSIIRENEKLLQKYDLIPSHFNTNMNRIKNSFSILNERLHNFSPLATLKRGYSIIRNNAKEIIYDAAQVKNGETLECILHKGGLQVAVIKGEQEGKYQSLT